MMPQTYTRRTQSVVVVYAARSNSLLLLMGPGGVEPPTSRLSGRP